MSYGCGVRRCRGAGTVEYRHGDDSYYVCDACWGALSPTELRAALGIDEPRPPQQSPPADDPSAITREDTMPKKTAAPPVEKPTKKPVEKPTKKAKATTPDPAPAPAAKVAKPKEPKEPKVKVDRGPLKTFAAKIPEDLSRDFHAAVDAAGYKSASKVAESLMVGFVNGDKAIRAAVLEQMHAGATAH